MIYIKRFFKAIWFIIAIMIALVICIIGVITSPLTMFIYYVVKGDIYDIEKWFTTVFAKLGVKFDA